MIHYKNQTNASPIALCYNQQRRNRHHMTSLFLFLSCKAPPDAPTEMNDLTSYLFMHIRDEDPEYLEAGMVNLQTWIEDHWTDVYEGYRVQSLTTEALNSVGENIDPEEIVGVAVGSTITYDPQTINTFALEHDPNAIYPDNYDFNIRTYLEGEHCWFDQNCPILHYESHILSKLPLGIEVESFIEAEYRWVELPDGTMSSVGRRWMQKPAIVNVDWVEVRQEYAIMTVIPTENGYSRMVDVDWLILFLGDLPMPEDMALRMGLDTIQKNHVVLQEYIDNNK